MPIPLFALALVAADPSPIVADPSPIVADPALIVVTGQGLAAPAGAAAYDSVTIGTARLSSDASGRIENVLRDVAGFQQFRRTDSRAANPTSQGATLRAIGGNASSRALVLLDGVPQADPFAGFIAWSAIDPAGLIAARVTRGGGAGPFGAGAVAGTIELFSSGRNELPGLSARLAGGSRDSLDVALGGSATLGQGFVSASANWQRGDGYGLIPPGQAGPIDVPAQYDSKAGSLRLVVPTGDASELQVAFHGFDDKRLRGVAGTDSTSQGADASLRLIGRGDWGYEALAYVQTRHFTSGFVSVNAARTVATPTLDQFDTPATGLGAKLELRPPLGAAHTLQMGADVRAADGATNERFRFVAGAPTRLRNAGGTSLTAGLYIEDSWRLSDALLLTGGARVDHWRQRSGHLLESDLASGAPTLVQYYADRSGTEPTARAGLVLTPGAGLSLRAAGYMGFRIPTLNELYRPFRVGNDATAANAGLNPEKLRGGELGFDWSPISAVTLSATAYWNRLNGAITNVTQGTGPGIFPQVGFVAAGGVYRVRQTIDAVTVKGLEANGRLTLGDWSLDAAVSWADPRVSASGAALALDGLRPAASPQFQASATLGWTHDGWAANTTLRNSAAQFDDDLNLRRLPPVTTLDASISVPLSRTLALTLRAENLFDSRVVSGLSGTGVIDLGTPRTVWVGVRWQRR